jgi:hypothetical protein
MQETWMIIVVTITKDAYSSAVYAAKRRWRFSNLYAGNIIAYLVAFLCDIYQMSFSEYMQQALVEAMRFDIEDGNFSDALLEKIGVEDSKKDNSPPSSSPLAPGLTDSDLDLLKKLQTQVS